MKRVARGRLGGLLGSGLVLVLLMALLPGGVGLAEDPEPTVAEVTYSIDSGPGWPEGWKPPDPPTEIKPEWRKQWEEDIAYLPPGDRPTDLKLKVLEPLPAWTNEYPYKWISTDVACGSTDYLFFAPVPDDQAIRAAFDNTYTTLYPKAGPGACQLTPARSIKLDPKSSSDPEQWKLYEHAALDLYYAQTGSEERRLAGCRFETEDGTVENIYVCFNDGTASEMFDAPAYADLSVGRVRVPLRFVSEMMGAAVEWNQQAQSVTIRFPEVTREVAKPVPNAGYTLSDIYRPESYSINDDAFDLALKQVHQAPRTIIVTLGSTTAYVDGKAITIDAPPVAVPPGRVMVPIRFIAESMGARVYWVGKTPIFKKSDGTPGGSYQVHIYTPFHPYFDNPNWFLENRAQKQ